MRVFILPVFAIVSACGNDSQKEDTSSSSETSPGTTDGTTDETESVPTHSSGFALVAHEVPPYQSIEATADWFVTFSDTELRGFIQYSERDGSGNTTCTATLSMYGLADEPPCSGCTFSSTGSTDIGSGTGACWFPDSETSLNHAMSFLNRSDGLHVSHKTDANVGGTRYDEVVAIDILAQGSVADSLVVYGDGSPAIQPGAYDNVSGTLTPSFVSTSEIPTQWLDCGSPSYATDGHLTAGELSLTSSLECSGSDASDERLDVWKHSLAFGEILTAGIKSVEPNLSLFLVMPNGCLAYAAVPMEPCLSDASQYCTSLEHTVTEGGEYSLVVGTGRCATGLSYAFDARIH